MRGFLDAVVSDQCFGIFLNCRVHKKFVCFCAANEKFFGRDILLFPVRPRKTQVCFQSHHDRRHFGPRVTAGQVSANGSHITDLACSDIPRGDFKDLSVACQ